MDRKQVVLSAEETLRQRDFERKLADIHRQRSRAPLALVLSLIHISEPTRPY